MFAFLFSTDINKHLTSLLQSVENVQSKFIWLTNMVGYVDLPLGSTEVDCFLHCSTIQNNCAVVVMELGRCHYGINETLTTSPDQSVLISDSSPWNVSFTQPYFSWFQSLTPRSEISGVPSSLWSRHVYLSTSTDLISNCAVYCSLHDKFWAPCTYYVYQNQTKTCYIADINRVFTLTGVSSDLVGVVHTFNGKSWKNKAFLEQL